LEGSVLELISDTTLSPRANYYGLRKTERAHPVSCFTACSKKRLADYMYCEVCYNEQFLSIKSGCYNERGGILLADVAVRAHDVSRHPAFD
jgi:hypothetical protein